MLSNADTIALVTPRYAPAIGGVERHVEALARGLVRRGIKVEVITTDPTGTLAPLEERDGVLVRRFPTLGNDSIFFVSPQLGQWLLRNAQRFSVLHAHSYHTPLALQAALAGKRHGVPLVLTPHYHGTGHSTLRRWLHVPYRIAGRWLVGRAQQIICVSETENELLKQHFGRQIPTSVVPNGVELDHLTHAAPRATSGTQKLIMTVGRLETYKQVDRVIAALPHLPAEYRLAVVGDGVARAGLEQLARSLGVADRVQFCGYVSQDELAGWYAKADVVASLSQHEAFGIVLLEAAMTGASIVASDIPAHREVAGYLPEASVHFVAQNRTPAQLARAVQEALQAQPAAFDPSTLPTWDATAEGALQCYRNVRNATLASLQLAMNNEQ